jgi:hypothetical protein
VDEEIEFAASHFCEIDADDLKGIDVRLLELIVSSDGLRLESEDSLLTFILNLGLEDALVLVRYLRSEYLSAKSMSLFLDGLGDSVSDPVVWDSLCHRLLLRLRKTVEKEKEANSLPGIISYLTKKHGGNVQEKGIVTITSKSVSDQFFRGVENVADLTSGGYFRSTDGPGQWVSWDFREMRVCPTHYTIWAQWLKSWGFEGSLDGSSWTEIDRRTHNEDFKDWNMGVSFVVSTPAEFRFIRLTQIGTDIDGHDCLCLNAVEFFGTLSE